MAVTAPPMILRTCSTTHSRLAVLVDDRRLHVHAVLAARSLQVARPTGVPEATAAEMHPDPDESGLVTHEVDIVVAARNDERADAQSRAISGAD
jgi:hypothetical protein